MIFKLAKDFLINKWIRLYMAEFLNRKTAGESLKFFQNYIPSCYVLVVIKELFLFLKFSYRDLIVEYTI